LPRDQRAEVEAFVARLDAHHVGVLDLVDELARGDQRLAGDAADVEADAADRLPFDDSSLQTELGAADRADVAGGRGNEDQHLVGHGGGAETRSRRRPFQRRGSITAMRGTGSQWFWIAVVLAAACSGDPAAAGGAVGGAGAAGTAAGGGAAAAPAGDAAAL